MQRDFIGKRRHWPFKGQFDAPQVTYKRFRRRIIQRSTEGPAAASTPVAAGCQCGSNFELDAVCQRLELDSPPRHREADPPAKGDLQGSPQYLLCDDPSSEGTLLGGVSTCEAVTISNTPHAVTARGRPLTGNAPEQGWVWRAAQEQGNPQQTGCDYLQPFAVLNAEASVSQQGKSVATLGAPSLLNDYYTNLLDCSCDGVVALALGSSVYLWNSETRALLGHLAPSPQPGRRCSRSVSSLGWSRDGRALCIGTRGGELQLWDVERQQNMTCLQSHLSVVGALSWKQQLLSSGSVLGHIHHHDPRTPTPLVGAAFQKEAVCSLQWSPGEERLASGSTGGLLHIWGGDIAGVKRSRQPIMTMKQPSAVKAMGWCPWQRNVIATGGGWKDGQLRLWDTQSESCLTSINTNSQICSLHWAERKRCLVTGHGIPHHEISCWSWELCCLSRIDQLTGHTHRVLHLAVNPNNTQIFSAGADQRLLIWDV